MAINLSRSFAKPCDVLCDLTVDDVAIPQAKVVVKKDMLIFEFNGQQPSIKYNGQGYTCQALVLKAPSWHTIEDIRADAECVAVCGNPDGSLVCVSTLLRTNTANSRTNTFLNSFIPYANTESAVEVKLGETWSLTQMIPAEPAYYTYKGTLPWGGDKAQMVVFRSMANIDPNDFALLTRAIGSVPSKIATRNQEVFFNDTQHISGVPDGKAYMRCRRVKKKGEEAAPRITPLTGLSDKAKTEEEKKAAENAWWVPLREYVESMGIGSVLESLIYLIAILGAIYAAYQVSQTNAAFSLATIAHTLAKTIRALIPLPRPATPQV